MSVHAVENVPRLGCRAGQEAFPAAEASQASDLAVAKTDAAGGASQGSHPAAAIAGAAGDASQGSHRAAAKADAAGGVLQGRHPAAARAGAAAGASQGSNLAGRVSQGSNLAAAKPAVGGSSQGSHLAAAMPASKKVYSWTPAPPPREDESKTDAWYRYVKATGEIPSIKEFVEWAKQAYDEEGNVIELDSDQWSEDKQWHCWECGPTTWTWRLPIRTYACNKCSGVDYFDGSRPQKWSTSKGTWMFMPRGHKQGHHDDPSRSSDFGFEEGGSESYQTSDPTVSEVTTSSSCRARRRARRRGSGPSGGGDDPKP